MFVSKKQKQEMLILGGCWYNTFASSFTAIWNSYPWMVHHDDVSVRGVSKQIKDFYVNI